MKAFIDTSSLVKKYILENGSDKLEALLKNVTEIVVSPTCLLEITSVLTRRQNNKSLTSDEVRWVETEVNKDYPHFSKIIWNEDLELKSIELVQKDYLKTLDSIQLASACLAKADIFVTSDKVLGKAAKGKIKVINVI